MDNFVFGFEHDSIEWRVGFKSRDGCAPRLVVVDRRANRGSFLEGDSLFSFNIFPLTLVGWLVEIERVRNVCTLRLHLME